MITALLAVVSGADMLTRTKLLGSLVSFTGVAVIVSAGHGLTPGQRDRRRRADPDRGRVLVDLHGLRRRRSCGDTRRSGQRRGRWSAARSCSWSRALFQAVGVGWGTVSADAWAGLLFSAFIPAGIANVVVFSAIRLLGPTRITAYQFLVPFMAVAHGRGCSSRSPSAIDQLLGGVIIVLGVAISRTDRVTAFGGWLRERRAG